MAWLDGIPVRRYVTAMKRVFDMDDRARLPWRFFGAAHSVLARL
ncbi:isopropylmalate isomerase [Rhodovulum marinum]|nr:isopropylmalate isomerase [Rhodovulum marinum]